MADRERLAANRLVRDHSHGVTLMVLVTARASRSEMVGPHGAYLRVRIAAPAEGGKAPTGRWSVSSRRCSDAEWSCCPGPGAVSSGSWCEALIALRSPV